VAAPGDDAPDGFVMPDLAGLPVVSAQAELTRVGIQSATNFVDAPIAPVGNGDALPRPPLKPGAVIAQWPQAGARVEQGTPVKLTVAK
jgi:beta-lactam-binding protein with PASTA domain